MTDHWSQFVERADEWTAPIRPSPEDVLHFQSQLSPNSRTLLLGVTPALQPFAAAAVDNNPKAVNSSPALAILADWSDLPFDSEFDAVIGDGCLNIFQGTPEIFFNQMKKVLKSPGKLILRIFISPDEKESLDDVLKAKEQMGFHAFKLRVTQALATPYISVQERGRIMKPIWNHPNLEVYNDSNLVYYHPKLSELPPWNTIQYSSSYELSERCPIITWCF